MVVTTTYLQQQDRGEVCPARIPDVAWTLSDIGEPAPDFARFLYVTVGEGWSWTDRLPWTSGQWRDWMARRGSETWVAWVAGAPAGYIELDSRTRSEGPPEVEIAYFGLLPGYLGRGLGGALLESGLRRAWAMNDADARPTGRVWVHTCTLDGPHALANYRSRGMSIYATSSHED